MGNWYIVAEKIKTAPKTPGVYVFLKGNEPLYVGKASNLRNRLNSYLKTGGFKNERLQENATDLKTITLRSEIEALIKEAKLIKKLRPSYNVLWRDDKSYFYAVVTKGKFPRIFVTHKNSLSANHYSPITNSIGPFTEGRSLRLVLKMLRRTFPYCTCLKPHLRQCLNSQIGNCPGFCCIARRSNGLKSGRRKSKTLSEQTRAYRKNIRTIENFLRGKPIKNFSWNLKPEEKEALEKILAHREFLEDFSDEKSEPIYPDVQTPSYLIEGYDISHLGGRETVAGMTAWFFDGEKLYPRKNFWRRFIIRTAAPGDDPAAMEETLKRRLNHPEWPYPKLIVIDGGIGQLQAARRAYAGLKARNYGTKIQIISFAKPNEEIYGLFPKPAPLSRATEELKKIIPRVVAETHNFAVRFHRFRRGKSFLTT